MLVTVVLCTYNSADTLETALDSALGQRFPAERYEVVLVDDGSTDRTDALVEQYRQHDNFRNIRLPQNRGLVAACNCGLKAAKVKYFIRLDADDVFHPEILARCVEPLEQDRTDFVFSDRYEVTLADRVQADNAPSLVQVEPFNLFNLIAIGTMLRTGLLREIGGYRTLFWEEYDLYIRYLQHSRRPPVRIPRPLYNYTRHPSSMTADPVRVLEGWEELEQMWGPEVLREFGWLGLEQQAKL